MFSTSYTSSYGGSSSYGAHQYSTYESPFSSSSAGSGRFYDGDTIASSFSSVHTSTLPRRSRTSSLARPLPVGPELDSSPYVSRKMNSSYGDSGGYSKYVSSHRPSQNSSASVYSTTTSSQPRRYNSSSDVRLSLARELGHYEDAKVASKSPLDISVIYKPSETNGRLPSRSTLNIDRSRTGASPVTMMTSQFERISANLPPTGKSSVTRMNEDRRFINGIDRRPSNSSSFDSGLSNESLEKKPPPLNSRSSSLYDYGRTNGGEILQVASLARNRSRQNGFVDDSGDEVMASPTIERPSRVTNGRIIADRIETGNQHDYDSVMIGAYEDFVLVKSI